MSITFDLKTEYWTDLRTPVGKLRLVADARGLNRVDFSDNIRPSAGICVETKILQQAKRELNEYFRGDRTEFDVPLNPDGTAFQIAVWNELLKIPYGTTTTYGEIARNLGNPEAMRAVGAANGRNPIAIIIPCHRVIGTNGKLIGYGGGIDRKLWLLKHEAAEILI
jgi:methylated-DNA-[protein]-cysteine S-methyltransferase